MLLVVGLNLHGAENATDYPVLFPQPVRRSSPAGLFIYRRRASALPGREVTGMPSKSRAVVSAEFDALTFRNVMDMKFTGPFMSARQHPQYWDMRITVTTPVGGGSFDVQKTTLRPDQKLFIGELAGLVKQQVREMGLPNATEVKVVARLVSVSEMAVWFRKRLQNGGVPRMDTVAGDSELDLLT